jgi:hypothetical protein
VTIEASGLLARVRTEWNDGGNQAGRVSERISGQQGGTAHRR